MFKWLRNRRGRRKAQKPETRPETTYIIYNPGTQFQFAECVRCGFEDEDQLFVNMMLYGEETFGQCPECGAKIKRALLAEEIR